MSYTITPVINLVDLESRIALLPPVKPGSVRLFRGQNKDFNGMIPSLYRGNIAFQNKDQAWKIAGQRLVKKYMPDNYNDNFVAKVNSPDLNFPIDGLIQHYGLRSGGLDVTSSLEIALWFAQCERVEALKTEILPMKSKHIESFLFRRASYFISEREFSYVYVFDCPQWVPGTESTTGDCVNLFRWFGRFTSRPLQQKGWYIYADNSIVVKGDLQTFIRACYQVPVSVSKEAGYDLQTLFYFPLPSADELYSRLLICYFMKNENGVYERLLDIPEYYQTVSEIDKDENKLYSGLVHVNQVPHFFKSFLIAIAESPHQPALTIGNYKWTIVDAELIKMKYAEWHLMPASQKKGLQPYVPELSDVNMAFSSSSYNYFIEFSPFELVVKDDMASSDARGVWIVQQNGIIGFQIFLHQNGKFGAEAPVWFNYLEQKKIQLTDDGHYSEIEKRQHCNMLTNALRVIQIYKKIPFFENLVR